MTPTDTLSAISQASSSSFSRASRETGSSSEGRSHTHWKLYRKEVLAPHHIRIVERTVLPTQLPEAIVGWINTNRDNVARFARQRKHFRKQVAQGRGFGDSALFPHEVLPWARDQPFIAKCMVPTYSAEPLPRRMLPDPTGKLSLSPPRPGFACGFASSAFAPEELKSIPGYLATSGTTLQFDTGSVSPDSALYCPFMTFERTFYQQKYGHEIAANQCAVNGAWCVRSLEMLHKRANGDSPDSAFEKPVSFTCAVDNNFAIINYHWVDHAQTYCMAPVVRFELSKDDHFNQFLIWIEAIGQWAVSFVLPEVKKAICLITDNFGQEPASTRSVKTSQNTTHHEDQRLVAALKLSYETVPWRLEGDDVSALSSSTASWGSPMIKESVFSKMKYPIHSALSPQIPHPLQTQMQIPTSIQTFGQPSSACSEPTASKTVRFASSPIRERHGLRLKPALDSSLAPWSISRLPDTLPQSVEGGVKASVDMSSDLVVSKRLSHAMDEIRDLQRQLMEMKQEFGGSTTCLQNELSGLRKSMTTVLRKERLTFKQIPGVRGNVQGANGNTQTEKRALTLGDGVSIITTPTDPTARPAWSRSNSGNALPRQPSGLQNMLTLETNMVASVNGLKSPNKITIFSPTIINITTDGSIVEDEGTEESEEESRRLTQVSHARQNNWSSVLTSHVLCALVPSAMLRVIFFGLILEYCMVFVGRSHTQSVSHYVSHVLESAITI